MLLAYADKVNKGRLKIVFKNSTCLKCEWSALLQVFQHEDEGAE
jgi:hypothetical protein